MWICWTGEERLLAFVAVLGNKPHDSQTKSLSTRQRCTPVFIEGVICSGIDKVWVEVLVQGGVWILGLCVCVCVCICFDLTSPAIRCGESALFFSCFPTFVFLLTCPPSFSRLCVAVTTRVVTTAVTS